MTRFWITLEQGVNFVLNSLKHMVGGEIFVPKIPSMNIMDLARAVAPECTIENVGIRPGEKLHEVMIAFDDARHTVELEDHYIIKPSFWFFDRRFQENGSRAVPENFEYNSGTNQEWLTLEQLQVMINDLE